MLKPFEELRKLDISKHVEKRDGKDYLNWAKCIDLLHENGASMVYFTPLTDEHGSSLFMSYREFTDKSENKNKCYEVAVQIVIDDLEFTMRSPVMNGSNPVKDNSMSQQRVWNAQTRAFVKGVAIRTGLGFGLWVKDDPDGDLAGEDDLSRHDIFKIKKRIEQLITAKMQKGLSQDDLLSELGMKQKQFDNVMNFFGYIYSIEQKLLRL